MAMDNDQAEYELREARSEISRHHKLIADLKEGLEWALEMIHFAGPDFYFVGEDKDQYDHYRRLLNRQVS